MDHRDPHMRATPTVLWFALIGALALIFAGSFVSAGSAQPYTGTVEPCLSGHGDRDRYLSGLAGTGWTDVAPQDRASALDMLADAYLPIILGVDQPLETLVARRAEARAFWEDLSQNRSILGRDGQVLLLAGFLSPEGRMIVECWVAGPEVTVTDDMMNLIGATYEAPGIRMAQVNLPAQDSRPDAEIFVSRLSLESPTLAATDALRTRVTFDMGTDL